MTSEQPTWKKQIEAWSKNIRAKLPKNWDSNHFNHYLKKSIQSFDLQAVLEWVSKTFRKSKTSYYGTLITIILSTYFLADIAALIIGDMIPEPTTQFKLNRPSYSQSHSKTLADYQPIFSRNLFNSRGMIPGDENQTNGQDQGGPPVKSSLPLNLIGTMIMEDETKSIATIEDKSASLVYPVQVEDEVPNKLKVIKVEPRRVIFVNKASGRREYLELPEDIQIRNPMLTPGRPSQATGVEKLSSTQFSVSRSEVDKALADFNNILTQARAVPNFENGIPSGYKLFQIVPGSIYDKLGLQNGDVIVGLNGQPINDPGKAFEMLSELKTSNHLELQVKKEGKAPSNYTYDIH